MAEMTEECKDKEKKRVVRYLRGKERERGRNKRMRQRGAFRRR